MPARGAGRCRCRSPRVRELLRLDVRDQIADRLLHHARALDDLRQEHPAAAEQIADRVHAGHQRPLDHVERLRRGVPRLLGVLDDVVADALDQRVAQALGDRRVAPRHVAPDPPPAALAAAHVLGDLEHPLGRVRSAVQYEVLGALPELRIDGLVDRERAGVDDAHVHAGANRVVQEHRVDRLAH